MQYLSLTFALSLLAIASPILSAPILPPPLSECSRNALLCRPFPHIFRGALNPQLLSKSSPSPTGRLADPQWHASRGLIPIGRAKTFVRNPSPDEVPGSFVSSASPPRTVFAGGFVPVEIALEEARCPYGSRSRDLSQGFSYGFSQATTRIASPDSIVISFCLLFLVALVVMEIVESALLMRRAMVDSRQGESLLASEEEGLLSYYEKECATTDDADREEVEGSEPGDRHGE